MENFNASTEVPTHNGHITVSATKYMCGEGWQYYGILSRSERAVSPRSKNNYLRFIPLKDVKCEKCKELAKIDYLTKALDLLNGKKL